MEISPEADCLADLADDCCNRRGRWRLDIAEAIQGALSQKDTIIAGLMDTIRFQAALLSDAGDIFDEVGLGHVWARRLTSSLVPQDGTTPHATAHQREAHDTLTAQ